MSESTVNPTPPTAPATPVWASETLLLDADAFNGHTWEHRGPVHGSFGVSAQLVQSVSWERGMYTKYGIEVRVIANPDRVHEEIDEHFSLMHAVRLRELLTVATGELTLLDAVESTQPMNTTLNRDSPPDTTVDSRFAGGSILVEQHEFLDQNVVKLAIPGGNGVPLFPHEARALAAALTRHADSVDTRRGALRRPTGTDDALRELDNE
ncbi:hypothetical protein MRBLWH7_000791 [Microbacterium sp. LWH7-1.2]|uniref:hypothetical protein n=1 Tax=Microbacterium sp. LWH7-1.2 TaxID=3135257 RepID=UPI003139A4F2